MSFFYLFNSAVLSALRRSFRCLPRLVGLARRLHMPANLAPATLPPRSLCRCVRVQYTTVFLNCTGDAPSLPPHTSPLIRPLLLLVIMFRRLLY